METLRDLAQAACADSKDAILMTRWTGQSKHSTPASMSVDEEIAALPANMRARLARISALIATAGLEHVREPHVKHLEGRLWEIRLTGQDGISRALYVTAREKRLVIVRVFIKKTQKTPRAEIELALARAKEVHA